MFVFRTQIWSVNKAIANEPCTGCIVSLTSQEIVGEELSPTLASSCSAANALSCRKFGISSCSVAFRSFYNRACFIRDEQTFSGIGVERGAGACKLKSLKNVFSKSRALWKIFKTISINSSEKNTELGGASWVLLISERPRSVLWEARRQSEKGSKSVNIFFSCSRLQKWKYFVNRFLLFTWDTSSLFCSIV